MTTFTATNRSAGSLASPVDRVWAALTDPQVVATCTPYVTRIEETGDRWRWHMTRIPVPVGSFSPTFTVVMAFDPKRRIDYRPAPEVTGEPVRVNGVYDLEPNTAAGTDVSIDLTIEVDLPIPRAMRRVVEGAMDVVVTQMGNSFATALARHLGERG